MLSIKTLPLRNLRGYAARSAAVALFAFLTAAVLFGGTLLTSSARNSLHTVQARLGADIMVTPESAKNDFDAQTALIKAEPASFYMDAAALEQIRATDGVERASPQLFLASAKAGCCSARLQMIAFDPETDFTIRPWIEDTDTLGEMGLMDVVIGSNVSWTSASQGDVIRFYDSDCRVIGQFAATGSTLDSAVYMNFDTCKALIQACREKGLFKYGDFDGERSISSVMVRVKKGYAAEEVAKAIRARLDGVSVVTASDMLLGLSENLSRVSGAARTLMLVLCLLGFFMAVTVFALMINERQREFATLRAMGASKSMVARVVLTEAMAANLAGALAGAVTAGVVLYAFGAFIGEKLNVRFVLPDLSQAWLPLVLSLLAAGLSASLGTLIALKRIGSTDAACALKEGE